MKFEASKYAFGTAVFITLVGLLLLFSIIGYISRSQGSSFNAQTGLLSRPGEFFFTAFHWVALYIPVYLFVSAYLLIARPFRRSLLYILTLSVLPFLSLSLFAKIMAAEWPCPLSDLIRSAFGRIPGAILTFLVSVIGILLLIQLHRYLVGKTRTVPSEPKGEEKEPEKTASLSEEPYFSLEIAAKRDPENGKNSECGSHLVDLDKESLSPSVAPLSKAAPLLANGYLAATDRNWEQMLADEKAETKRENEEYPRKTYIPTVTEESEDYVEDAEFERIDSREDDNYNPSLPLPRSAPPARKKRNYFVPVTGILKDYKDGHYWKIDDETRRAGDTLMRTLEEFKISAELTGIQKGPVITMFEILPSPGVKLSKIVNLADNIALRLAAFRVRIVAPIPGKHAVGIEVPNKVRATVPFKEMVTMDKFHKSGYEIPIVLGKDISGEAQIVDMVQTPHLLIAGATGSGKSVCVNSIIASILYKRTPAEVRLLLIDPKIVELKSYNDVPHLLTPVITDPKHSFQALQYCIYEMERRYSLLDALAVRDIRSYNRKVKEKQLATTELPYLVIIIDEFADLMATTGKEMESTLARLAAMSRAVGIHLVLATQRPSVDVITGLIKANIPSRIAFMVASKFDSRIIIDTIGADKLLGQGDMLFTSAWDPTPIRIQGSFLSEEEIEAITGHVKTLGEPEYIDDEIFFDEEDEELVQEGEDDPLFDKALDIVVTAGKASASYLQRRLKIGYNRAARLVENMEMRGIVGPAQGSKPREIIHIPDRN